MSRSAVLFLFLVSVGSGIAAEAGFASHPRPAGATPTRVALVPAMKECTNPNARHGPPLDKPSCAPPVQTSQFLTVGTTDANGAPPKSTGFVRFDVFFCPQCASPINEDLRISARMTDVRLKNLDDYAGELQATVGVRLSDHYNSVTGAPAPACSGTISCPATVEETVFAFAVPCAPTTDDDTVGSTCEVLTSALALIPGVVRMGSRATWELGQVRVFDGGADGEADTPDNTLFAVQGVFLP